MGTILKKKQISKILNIKGNLLMLDTTEIFLSKKKSISKKKINICDWFFKEHLIDNPLMPGILITETMLQSSICILKKKFKLQNKQILIIKKNVSFLDKINKENGILKTNTIIKKSKSKYFQSESTSFFKSKKIAHGKFMFIKYENKKI
ncbi:hypothetical protein [Candidatus Pelagibacter sp.]|uniref:hypothetical protein n=1 Tax=Candidatus Pelagibacter sp. TaxID=2024849 RepID=UPI003F868449